MKRIFYLIALISLLSFSQACHTTRVVASPHGDAPDFSECHETTNWSYLWGLQFKEVDVQPDVLDPDYCVCTEGRLSWAESRTTFGGALLSLVTLGIVNYRKVRWACAPEQHIDDDIDN